MTYTPDPHAIAVHAVALIADIREDLIPRIAADLALAEEAPEGETVDLAIVELLCQELITVFSRPGLTPKDLSDFETIKRLLLD